MTLLTISKELKQKVADEVMIILYPCRVGVAHANKILSLVSTQSWWTQTVPQKGPLPLGVFGPDYMQTISKRWAWFNFTNSLCPCLPHRETLAMTPNKMFPYVCFGNEDLSATTLSAFIMNIWKLAFMVCECACSFWDLSDFVLRSLLPLCWSTN